MKNQGFNLIIKDYKHSLPTKATKFISVNLLTFITKIRLELVLLYTSFYSNIPKSVFFLVTKSKKK